MKWKWLLSLVVLVVLAGCGGGPKKDVSIFILPSTGLPQNITEKMETDLQAKVGESPTVAVHSSPIYNDEKLLVEIAAGDHSLVILPKKNFEAFARQGSFVSLDDLFKPEDYPSGVVEAPVGDEKNPKMEKHLYGIPLGESKWLKDSGYKGEELYAFVHPRAPQMDKAKQVLQVLASK
ncbi:hypothetical protein MJA45_21820 [Paenibacillus aurantius]|uniref:Lipoprotein YteS n=1 Tax=Paenibacillus aurantius TaxID=2918900 RepID=A0AA96LAU0_9BACL|nr:hypothetical protein [Paenibacillus aurantius]WNQ10236.1 hypothetical protein MJA45_21820 [Paenibacillus aurantius]